MSKYIKEWYPIKIVNAMPSTYDLIPKECSFAGYNQAFWPQLQCLSVKKKSIYELDNKQEFINN